MNLSNNSNDFEKISEKKYKSIIENLQEAIVILDFDGRFIYASPQYYKLIGSEVGIHDRINFERIHPDDRKELIKLFRKAAKQERSEIVTPIDFRVLHDEGHYIWISSISNNYYDENGNVIGFISTMRDITKTKTVEQQFLETEAKYHSFIDNFQGIIYQAETTSSKLVFIGGSIHEITGYQREDFYNEIISWYSLILEDDFHLIQENLKKLEENSNKNVDLIYRIRDKEGDLKWVRDYARIISRGNKKGDIIQGAIYDITQQVITDKKLQISEGRYKRITENANDLIVVFNQDYEIEYINENVHKKLLGYTNEDINRQLPLDFIHPSDQIKIRKFFFKISKEGESSGETRLLKKDGDPVWLHLKGNTFIDVDGKKKFLLFAIDITIRKKTEQKIKESERKYRLITENANDIICIINDKFKLEYVNEEPCYRITGFKATEILGRDVLSMIHPDDIDKTIKTLNQGIIKGEGAIDTKLQKKNGEYIWLDIKGKVFYDENDELKIILTARDVSFRKKVEKELKESEEKLRTFMNSATDAFIMWDSELNLIDISDVGIKDYFPEEILRDALIGKNITDIVPDIETSRVYPMFKSVLMTGEPVTIEHNYIRPSLGTRFISVKAFKVSEGLGMIVSDTTQQKLAEDKLKESERKYKQLFETSPYAIFLVSLDGSIIDCNPATELLFGYEKSELLNKKFKDLTYYPQKYQDGMIKCFKDVIMGKGHEPTELEIFKKDGMLAWILTHLNLVKLGSEYLVQAIVFDITENKRAQNLIQQEIERLRELDQIRNDLVRRISHELKTPLISIFSTSQHLLENYKHDLNEKTLKLISTIHKGGKRLKVLSDNLINSLRLEASGIKLNLQNQDIVRTINETIESLEIFIDERNQIIKKEIPDKLFFKIDEIWFSQVLSNLLSNAIKNTPPLGAILVKLVEERDYIDLIVSDTGVGITERERGLLFTRFGKIERYNEDLDIVSEGSGLGLYISREIIQLHDGEILVESKGRNKGSIFTIRLHKNEFNV